MSEPTLSDRVRRPTSPPLPSATRVKSIIPAATGGATGGVAGVVARRGASGGVAELVAWRK
jgi:hypothetical protein